MRSAACPFGITTIIGLARPAAIRLSMICTARPPAVHSFSSPP
jgi:hypothetical protein